jgi:hypothetical protein
MRRRRSTVVVAAVLGLVLVAGACSGDDDDADPPTAVATDDTGGTQPADGQLASVPPADGCTGDRAVEDMTCRGLTNLHVTEGPEYPFEPPVGGDHNPVWANCGLYDGVVPPAFAVHSLEHGAVWITYSTDVSDEQLRTLDAMVGADPKLLVSALNDAPAPFVLSAWGVQRYVASIDDPAVAEFIDAHEDADTAPEPGYPCSGGTGEPVRLGDEG